jgi:hypothetical protein
MMVGELSEKVEKIKHLVRKQHTRKNGWQRRKQASLEIPVGATLRHTQGREHSRSARNPARHRTPPELFTWSIAQSSGALFPMG